MSAAHQKMMRAWEAYMMREYVENKAIEEKRAAAYQAIQNNESILVSELCDGDLHAKDGRELTARQCLTVAQLESYVDYYEQGRAAEAVGLIIEALA